MRAFLLAVLFLSVAMVVAAQDRLLILTIPDPAEPQADAEFQVLLDSAQPVVIGSDGNLVARGVSVSPELCTQPENPDPGANCGGAQVDVTDFRINGQSSGVLEVFPNQTLNMTWTSRGAWECLGSGLPGTSWNSVVKNPSGSQSVADPNLEPGGLYAPELICRNGTILQDTATLSLSVLEPTPVPEGCENRIPAQFTRTQACIFSGAALGNDCFLYPAIFGSSTNPFPGPSGSQRNFVLRRGEYAAMQFTVPTNLNRQGTFNVVEAQFGVGTAGRKIWSISKCPGDFDRAAITADYGGNCYRWVDGGSGAIAWAPAGSASAGYCELEPGETYYLNLVYTESEAGTAPADLVWRCPNNDSICGNNMSVVTSLVN